MKVKIGPYKNWFGPYQLAEKLCFWAKPVKDEYGIKDKPEWVHNFGEWLAHGSVEPDPTPDNPLSNWGRDRPTTWLYKFLLWIDSKKERTIKVHIDPWDTWSMDDTLAYIVLPMLKQLKETKHGAPFVDDKDVPKELRSTSAPALTEEEKNCGATDDFHFKRWDWVLDEMIFAFDSKVGEGKDWEDQFHSGEIEFSSKVTEFDSDGKPKLYEMVRGPNDTHKWDRKGHLQYHKRISNGFRLFGRYYENLWD